MRRATLVLLGIGLVAVVVGIVGVAGAPVGDSLPIVGLVVFLVTVAFAIVALRSNAASGDRDES